MTAVTRQARRPQQEPPVLKYRLADGRSPLQRISLLREGIPADALSELSARLRLDKGRLLAALDLPRSTAARKEKQGEMLSKRDGEGVLGLYQLIELVEEIVKEGEGPPDFDAAAWLGAWLQVPLPALGHVRPLDLLDTAEGVRLLLQQLRQSQTGAYA
ncbi:MAG: DUF2384 domain-containing protein [Xanthomonadales bacterium]|jgi:putative toxin-antitoxin system antitoxin component (TIGR02293 family)|nr:DUF2384 domain-containing protein [Xanthomonadales bacterium]